MMFLKVDEALRCRAVGDVEKEVECARDAPVEAGWPRARPGFGADGLGRGLDVFIRLRRRGRLAPSRLSLSSSLSNYSQFKLTRNAASELNAPHAPHLFHSRAWPIAYTDPILSRGNQGLDCGLGNLDVLFSSAAANPEPRNAFSLKPEWDAATEPRVASAGHRSQQKQRIFLAAPAPSCLMCACAAPPKCRLHISIDMRVAPSMRCFKTMLPCWSITQEVTAR